MLALIEALDPADDTAVRAAYAVFQRAERHGRPRADVMAPADFAANLATTIGAQPWAGWVALAEGEPVGVALLTWPTTDNLHVCWGSVSVVAEHRRRRVGTQLLATLIAAGRALDRRTLEIEVAHPLDGGTSPGEAFLAAAGLKEVMFEQRAELPLPVPTETVDRLRARVPDDLDHALQTWGAHCPQERSAAFRAALEAFVLQAPTGDREVEATRWSAERLRSAEDRREAAGRTSWSTGAFAADGECAAFTELFVAAGEAYAHQSATLVLPEHRGHRLGVAVKIANLLAMQRDRPDLTHVSTYVAPGNTYMHDVNDALGFVPVETLTEWALAL